MKNVPYNRPTISKKDLISVLEHLIDDDLSNGQTTEKFEKEFGRALGLNDRVILTNSGSSALLLIFQHCGLQKGDEVILSPLCEPWVGELIHYFSAVPVWVDISVETLQMNPEHLLQKITLKTRSIILSHHFGYPFFMNPTLDTKEKSPLYFLEEFPQIQVIEDVTSGLFTRYYDQCLGSFGDYAFTCLENPRIITTGRGGAAFTKGRREAKEVRQLRSYREKVEKEENPSNSSDGKDSFSQRLDLTLSDMQSALGLSELSLIEKVITRGEQIKRFYQDSLSKGRHSFIVETEEMASNHSVFPVILQGDVNTAQKLFKKEKIEVKDIVEGTCYQSLPYLEELKNIHQLKHKVLLIPIYPTLRKEEIEKITLLTNSIR